MSIYLKNSYLFSYQARVIYTGIASIKGKDSCFVRLDDTIFHPQGGGQPSDVGKIDGYEVSTVVKQKVGDSISQFVIDHYMPSVAKFSVGQVVHLQINPTFRKLNMRLHTAGHLIAHVAEQRFSLKATKGHHFPSEGRVTFDVINPLVTNKGLMESIAKDAQELINKNAAVSVQFSPVGERSIKIEGFPSTPCGGTHVSCLGEVGKLAVLRHKISKQSLHLFYDVQE